jgi:hypothetical protein
MPSYFFMDSRSKDGILLARDIFGVAWLGEGGNNLVEDDAVVVSEVSI